LSSDDKKHFQGQTFAAPAICTRRNLDGFLLSQFDCARHEIQLKEGMGNERRGKLSVVSQHI
jgi:hypothetical protein